MDVFGTVVGAISLIGKIVGYLQAVKGAKEDRLKLLSEASALRALLDILHSRLDDTSNGARNGGALDMLVKAGIGGPLNQCYQALRFTVEELERIASHAGAVGSFSFAEKMKDIKWFFRREETKTTLNKIDRLKSLISLAFQTSLMGFIDKARDELAVVGLNVEEIKFAVSTLEADHRAHMKQTESLRINTQSLELLLQGAASGISKIEDMVAIIQQDHTVKRNRMQADLTIIREGQELQEVLQWVSPLDFSGRHSVAFEKRAADTGTWFLEHPKFLAWRRGEYDMLWCPGNPGVGKSVMASLVIHELQRGIPEDTAVVFIYFEYTTNYTIVQLLEAILKQLIRRRITQSSMESLRELMTGSRPTLGEILAILKVEIGTYAQVFAVLDALDETTTQIWTPLLEHLQTLSTSVRILATSRDLGDIATEFQGKERLDVMTYEGDMRKYIEGRLSDSTGALKRLLRANAFLREEIVTGIMVKADGMFLLAQLHMNSLETKARPTDLCRALSELPGDLKSAYDATMARITDENKPLVYRILSWVIHAIEPLTIYDLQYALAVGDGAIFIDTDDLYDEAHLTSICAGLVTLHTEIPRMYHRRGKVVALVHSSTQEYLREHASAQFPHPSHCAVACLRYLSFDIFRANDWWPLIETPLAEYAIYCWDDHAHKYFDDTTVRGLVMNLLHDTRKVSLLGSMFDDIGENISATHLCTYLGLKDYLEHLLNDGFDPNSKDLDGNTVATYAAADGREEIVRLLLSREGVDVNARGWNGAIPLTRAVMNGHQGIVELLLDTGGVDVNSRDNNGRTPLGYAAKYGNNGIMELLLARDDVKINVQDEEGLTPLAWAILEGREEIVQRLLKRDDVDTGILPVQLLLLGPHG